MENHLSAPTAAPTAAHYTERYTERDLLVIVIQQNENILRRLHHMTASMVELTREVSETGTVMDSAVVLLGSLSQMIRDNLEDPIALAKLAGDLDAQQAALAAAIVANTVLPHGPDGGGAGIGDEVAPVVPVVPVTPADVKRDAEKRAADRLAADNVKTAAANAEAGRKAAATANAEAAAEAAKKGLPAGPEGIARR